jgi:2-C-methyl-D-erythritol 4-phosphate cytidylyltransferase
MIVWTIVVAAGSGTRFGGPKQYAPLGSRRVIDWSLATARQLTDGVVAVVPSDRVADPGLDADTVVAGGPTRSASVRAGLAALPADATHVLVHDAARPVPLASLWRRVLDALFEGADAVVPVVPLTDTLREVEGGTVDRDRFVAVQTPQGFRVDVLRGAHRGDPDGTDDASLVEAAGGKVVVVDGDRDNVKVTNSGDLAHAELLTR